jgi:hypothetical protein
MEQKLLKEVNNSGDKEASENEAIKKAFEKSIWCVVARHSSLSFDNSN